MSNGNNYCVIMAGGTGSRFGRIAEKNFLNSLLIFSELGILYCNRRSIVLRKSFLQKISL